MKSFALVCFLLAATTTSIATANETKPESPWTPAQTKALIERVTLRIPFLDSDEAHTERATLHRFFKRADYAQMRGNPIAGYWHTGKFQWRGTRVAWDGVVSIAPSAKRITKRAWDAAFAVVAEQQGLIVDPNAPIRIRGVCLGAVGEPSIKEPNRGVLLELRIDSPTGPFRYRLGMGKPTLEDAVGASLDWAISFARAQAEAAR